MKNRPLRIVLSLLVVVSVIFVSACGASQTPVSNDANDTNNEESATTAAGNNDRTTAATEASAASETTNESSEETKSATREDVTLSLRGTDPNPIPGIQENDVFNYIKDKLGVTINYILSDPTRDKVTLASGDLPDIMQISDSDLGTYITGGHLACLDDYLDEYGPDLTANMPLALEFSRQNLSSDTGKLYGLTANCYINKVSTPNYNYALGMFLRWDYYKELGYPEIVSNDDYLNVLKQMQTAHPRTDDGKMVYGISGWTDWGLWAFYVSYAFSHGWMNGDADAYLFDPDGNIQPTFSKDGGIFKDAIQFLNKGYNMGLVDPEMFSQTNADWITKFANLQYVGSMSSWWNSEASKTMLAQGIDSGFYIIPGATPTVWEGYGSPIAGLLMDRCWTIANKCSYPERAMAFLNFCYSFEGNFLLRNGIEGVHWQIENGKPEYTDETLEKIKNDPQFGHTTGVGIYNNLCGISGDSRDSDGNFISLTYTEKSMSYQVSESDIDFNNHYGVSYPGQAFLNAEKEGKSKISYFDNTWQGFVPDQPNDMLLIKGKLENYKISFVTKCAMSKDDAEFEDNWVKGCEELDDMGYGELYDWYDKTNKDAMQKVKDLQ